MNKKVNQRNSLDNSAIIKKFFQAAKKTAIASLLSHCLRKYRSKWQVLRLLLLVTELTDELKYDIVVPLTTSVELYQFFLSDVVIFVENLMMTTCYYCLHTAIILEDLQTI